MIFERFDRRTSFLMRLVLLGLVVWSVAASSDPPATSGHGLAVSILLGVGIVGWLVWLRQPIHDEVLPPELFVLAVAGAGLLAASPNSGASVIAFVAIVTSALRVPLARAAWIVALATLALAVGVIIWDAHSPSVLFYVLGFFGVVLAGSNARQFRLRAEQAEVLLAQSQRSREEALRAARLEESTRLAREIHDVLAHSLAGLTIQLEATTALIENGADPDAVLARVRRAHELARDGLRETRRAVGALRGEDVPVAEALRTLADGHPATFVLRGDGDRLRGDVGQAVLRVVQESLTNVAKHAPGAVVFIDVEVGEEIVATVQDRHAGVPVAAGPLHESGGGYGIAGMRERALALGGTLEAGPTGDGWRVRLCIPGVVEDGARE